MKTLLLAGLLLSGSPSIAQKAYEGPELSVPPKRAGSIIIHTTDSANIAYKKAGAGLLAAGCAINKSDKELLFVSSMPKPLKNGVYLTCQFSIVPTAAGSDITYRGTFTWNSAVTQMANIQDRILPVLYPGQSSGPVGIAWSELQSIATKSFAGCNIGYK